MLRSLAVPFLAVFLAPVSAQSEDAARLIDWDLERPDAGSVSEAAASVERAGGPPERSPDGGGLARDPRGTAVRLVASSTT